MKRLISLAFVVFLLILAFGGGWLTARLGYGSAVPTASLNDLERKFSDQMQGAALVGYFTISGREDRPLRPDRYEISSVQKIGDDRWRFNAKIGETGISAPIPVPMQWLGDTPVITMTDFTIPGMGTFTCRVAFYGDRYFGTWQHGQAGGHMFGKIEKMKTQT